MSLSIGIIGLPNVGKSTLFNALLKRQAALVANYPFATIEPNVGVVDVPDERIQKLSEMVKNEFAAKNLHKEVPEKIIPAMIKFYDIAGLVKGAHEGEGLGNEFLGHIREVDAILHVVRLFTDANVVRAGSEDAKSDVETVNTELILADLSALEKRSRFLESDLRGNKSKENLERKRLYDALFQAFNDNKLASDLNFTTQEKAYLKDLNLLTLKPVIYVLNTDENNLKNDFTQNEGIDGRENIRVCAKIENELGMIDPQERIQFMQELGLSESGLDKVIKKSYELLGLQTFFTAGPKEVHAWTINKGDKAPQAAGKIHTDFERGFISAEIAPFDGLINAGSWKNAKEKGLVRLEGKNYIMSDGDVVEFHFNV